MKSQRAALVLAIVAAILASHAASAKVQFMKVLPTPTTGQRESIIIKNVGSEPVDLTGWSVVDKSKRALNSFYFGGDSATMQRAPVKWCSNWTTLAPDQEFTLKPFNRDRFSSAFDPCGFRFSLDFDGQLELRNKARNPVDIVAWTKAKPGMAVYRMNDRFIPFVENQDLKTSIRCAAFPPLRRHRRSRRNPKKLTTSSFVSLRRAAPVLSTFAKALHSTGLLDDLLKEGSSIKVAEDSWMAKALARTGYEKTYYKGPWTIFAPSDAAFKDFMKEMGWMGMTLTEEELLAMPELEEILKYHIILGQEWSASIRNATGLLSMKGGSLSLPPILSSLSLSLSPLSPHSLVLTKGFPISLPLSLSLSMDGWIWMGRPTEQTAPRLPSFTARTGSSWSTTTASTGPLPTTLAARCRRSGRSATRTGFRTRGSSPEGPSATARGAAAGAPAPRETVAGPMFTIFPRPTVRLFSPPFSLSPYLSLFG